MWVSLPVGIEDPVRQHAAIRDATADLDDTQQAVGARALTELAGFAPPTIMGQAARLQQRQRFFNLVVTNVPARSSRCTCSGAGCAPCIRSSRWPAARRSASR